MESEKSLVKIQKRLIKISKNFVVLGKEAFEDVKELDAIRAYEPLEYITVPGQKSFQKERRFLKQAFSREMFNILDYIPLNNDAIGFTAYLKTGNELEACLNQIEEDVIDGYLPFKYAVYLGMNLQKLRRYKQYR